MKEDIQYETCEVFPYIAVPMLISGFIICIFDSSHSGKLLGYSIILSLFGLSCKVSAEMIIKNDISKKYRKGQACAASQKMYTDLFTVLGECIRSSQIKEQTTADVAVAFE